MQTFLPYDSVVNSVAVLDRKRLGKQRVEAIQILRTLTEGGGWHRHPAVQMWRGHEPLLRLYLNECIREWQRRGYANSIPQVQVGHVTLPPWWGGPIHSSHRAALLSKDLDHYLQFDWDEVPEVDYVWPV